MIRECCTCGYYKRSAFCWYHTLESHNPHNEGCEEWIDVVSFNDWVDGEDERMSILNERIENGL